MKRVILNTSQTNCDSNTSAGYNSDTRATASSTTEEPKAPVLPETKEEAHFINPTDKTAQLPETGSEDSNLAIFGLASLLAGFGLYGAKRRKR